MGVTELASRCAVEGVSSLRDDERAELRSLYLKEARKGSFRPESADPSTIRTAFCEHVQREFGPAVLTVVDYLPYLRRKASEQLSDPTPLAALVLYATWIEHWVNVLIGIGMQRHGNTESEVEDYFALQPRFKDKIERLASLCSAPLPTKPFGWVHQVMRTRARYHHYVWKGMPGARIAKDVRGTAALARKGEAMIDQLLAFERSEFDAPLESLAFELFPLAC